MDELLKILATGIIAGIISPLILAYIQQRIIWRSQKRTELKKSAFDEATLALAMYEADAMNVELHANKPVGGGLSPVTHLRPETTVQTQKALALVEAFYAPETFAAYTATLSSGLSPKNVPNTEHYQRKTTAIRLMAGELGLLG